MNEKTESKDGRRVDRWLIRSGIALATCSTVFAGVMIAYRDHPRVFAMDRLAIFAQPNRSIRLAQTPSLPARRGREFIDTTPTGSIAPRELPIDPSNREIIAVSTTTAWIKSGDTIFAVTLGENLAGLGRVASIVRRDGAWRLLDDEGKELMAQATGKSSKTATPSGKSLIFEESE